MIERTWEERGKERTIAFIKAPEPARLEDGLIKLFAAMFLQITNLNMISKGIRHRISALVAISGAEFTGVLRNLEQARPRSFAAARISAQQHDEFTEDHAETKEIRSTIDQMTLTPALFRTHVFGRPGNNSRAGPRILAWEGDPEIDQNRLPLPGEDDVARLDVTMDEPRTVHYRKDVGDLGDRLRDLGSPDRPPPHGLPERVTLDQLGYEIGEPFL